ncbi:hypothetical protein evm_015618 [Chilo suppressalis]|nr:hypothetical protein evm_015618 [Chilo suppressalis]
MHAALGPAALDLVHNGKTAGSPLADEEYYAKTLLAVSVLSVVISAPLGAILIAITGPRLLNKDDDTPSKRNEDKEIDIEVAGDTLTQL